VSGCPVPGCAQRANTTVPMCQKHWVEVSEDLKMKMFRAFDETKQSAEFVEMLKRAVEEVSS